MGVPVQGPIRLKCFLVTAHKWGLGQGDIFAPVCYSVHRGVCFSARWDILPPIADTPPGSRLLPVADNPLVTDTPLVSDPPCALHAGRYGCYASYWNAFLLATAHPSAEWRHLGPGCQRLIVQSFPLPVSVSPCGVPEVGDPLQSWRLCVIGGSRRHQTFWACAGSPQLQWDKTRIVGYFPLKVRRRDTYIHNFGTVILHVAKISLFSLGLCSHLASTPTSMSSCIVPIMTKVQTQRIGSEHILCMSFRHHKHNVKSLMLTSTQTLRLNKAFWVSIKWDNDIAGESIELPRIILAFCTAALAQSTFVPRVQKPCSSGGLTWTRYVVFYWKCFEATELMWEREQDRDQNESLYIMSNLHTATYVGT